MENTKKNSLGNKVISPNQKARTASWGGRAPGPAIWFFQDHQWKQRHNPSYKQQATSVKPQAPIFRKRQAASVKLQALKLQATSVKL